MEKNTELTIVGAPASAGDNLYPNLPSKLPGEEEKKDSSVKPQLEKPQFAKPQFAKPQFAAKIAPASLLYAIFFTFCLYKNASGITYPFYVAGTIGFAVYTIRKSGISWRGEHILTLAASLLIGISSCFTDNTKIILLNKAWLFVLMMYFLLAVCFDTKSWQIGKFLESMLELPVRSIGKLFSFFPDAQAWMEEHKGTKNTQVLYIFAGVGASIPLLAVVLIMLSSADAIFRESMEAIFGDIKGYDVFCCILWSFAIFLFSYGMASVLEERDVKEEVTDHRTGQPVIAISATALIAVIYIYFCAIQVVCLFAGYGTLPVGYTYAQYARQGFFQLLFICLMNLVLVLVGLGLFRESKGLKGILLVISLCTFVMVASSAYRMLLYISVYQLTFLRIFVLWALLVIAFLMAGIVGKTLKNTFPLFRYGLAVITCCYLVLSFGQPDYWIARYNISAYKTQMSIAQDGAVQKDAGPKGADVGRDTRTENSDQAEHTVDTWYLRNLSADAAPVIMTESSMERYRAYEAQKKRYQDGEIKTLDTPSWDVDYIEMQKEKADKMSFRSYNFSRGYVRRALQEGQRR